MAEFMIPKEIIKLLEEADWISLATRDSNNEPNAANKFLLNCKKDTVYLVDFVKAKTWENIKNHPRVCFPIMDTENLVDYQLSGMAEPIEEGRAYDELLDLLKHKELEFSSKRIIEGIRREKGHTSFDFPSFDNVVFFKVKVDDVVVRGPSAHPIK